MLPIRRIGDSLCEAGCDTIQEAAGHVARACDVTARMATPRPCSP